MRAYLSSAVVLLTRKLKTGNVLITLFLIAFLLRVLFLLTLGGGSSAPVDDGKDYYRIGVNLSQNGGFWGRTGITARRPPLYPFAMSWFFRLISSSLFHWKLLQCLLGACMVLLVYRIGKLCYGRETGILAAFFLTFYPLFIFLPSRILTENIFTLLVLAFLTYLLDSSDLLPHRLIISGMILGLAILTRPALLLFPPFFFLWLKIRGTSLFRSIGLTTLFVIGVSLAVLPWTVRNYLLFHTLVPVTSNSGITFMHDNNPYVLEMGWAGPQNRIFRPEVVFPELKTEGASWASLNEAQQDKMLFRKTLNWIAHHQSSWLRLVLQKVISYFNFKQASNTAEHSELLMDLVGFFSYGILLPFMAIGFGWTFRHRGGEQKLLHMLFLSLFVGVLLYAGSVRIRAPIEPVLLIFAAYSLARLLIPEDC